MLLSTSSNNISTELTKPKEIGRYTIDMFESITRKFQFKFKDRVSAANILAAALMDNLNKKKEKENNNDIIVLGIPRGGVITADVVARKSSAMYFDIVIPRKLTDIDNKEQSIGAIMEDGTTYLDKEIIEELSIPDDYIEKEKAYQIQEIKRRTSLYRGEGLEYKISGKVAILVDDGAATGATIIAAARWLKKENQNPKRLIIAIPVAPTETVKLLKNECDDTVVVTTSPSSSFRSVSQYYQVFDPITDEQVITIMKDRGLLSP
jgi:putative phosphoribosyl transferase